MLVREHLEFLIKKIEGDIKKCRKTGDKESLLNLKSQLKALKAIRRQGTQDFLNSDYEELRNEMFTPTGEILDHV